MLDRRTIRYVAATISAAIALIYFFIGLGVITVITPVEGDPSMFVFGLLAGSAFLVGAGLLVAVDRRVLWGLGALLQVMVVWGYIAVAPERTPSFETWGITLRVIQVPLFAVLVYLAFVRPVRRAPVAVPRGRP